MKPLRSAALAALLVLAALVSACGGGGGAADADPATAAPANAQYYAEVAVRPEGDLREDALAAAGKVLRTGDPEREIREFVDRAFAESDANFDYDRDLKPWLGERVGVWGSVDTFVVVMAATDTEEALSALEDAARREGDRITERSYGDADYFVDGDGFAAGVAGDFALAGPEAEFKRAVDALEGTSLAESERYRRGVDRLDDARLAHFYADLRAIFELAAREDPESVRPLQQFIPFDRLPPLTGAFLANGDRLALDMGVDVPEDNAVRDLGAFFGGSTELVRELPGDTWLAVGSPRVGETWSAALEQLGGGLGTQALEQQLRSATGLDLRRDLLDWIGDVAFFMRGTTPDALDGGVVIAATDRDRAAAAFGRIVGALRTRARLRPRPVRVEGAETAFAIRNPSLPRPFVLARGNGKVVVTYGPDAAAEALDPSEPFGDADTYDEAQDVLGDGLEPAMLLSLQDVVALVESGGQGDADFERVRPYLEAFTTIALGATVEGDRAEVRIAAGLE